MNWDAGDIAGLVSAAVHITGYGFYLSLIRGGAITPNATSVALWLFGNVVSLWAYGLVTQDLAKLAVPIACTAGMVLVAVEAVRLRRFVVPDATDLWLAALDVCVIATWLVARNASTTYVALLIDTVFSFVPILRSTWRTPSHENWRPWFIWTAAYGLMFAVALLHWEGWMPAALPLAYVVCHLAVGLVSTRAATDTRRLR
ncbi:MAG: hypothetical protein INF91_02235 [Alphaproteobacteria bacterium]|nr:hypothetical protein [Alphaproteobacteria bacterium]